MMAEILPIYFLDRVDVLFDDYNCERFVDMLQGIEKKSQIIVITHNKKVVTASAQITGITQEGGDGVSKVCSLHLVYRYGMF